MCPAFGKRSNVCGKMNHWKGSEGFEKVRSASQDSDCSDSDSDVAPVKPLVPLLMASRRAKTSQYIVKCSSAQKKLDYKWTVEPQSA